MAMRAARVNLGPAWPPADRVAACGSTETPNRGRVYPADLDNQGLIRRRAGRAVTFLISTKSVDKSVGKRWGSWVTPLESAMFYSLHNFCAKGQAIDFPKKHKVKTKGTASGGRKTVWRICRSGCDPGCA
ncbi:MAG: hypothetical protein JNM30_07735 [Rhodospirillales bacterium]|nr:hypothetical protein [Rhodospirillales bacterium]